MKKSIISLSIRNLIMLFFFPIMILIILSCIYFYHIGKTQINTLIEDNAKLVVNRTCDELEIKIDTITTKPYTLTNSSYYYKIKRNILSKKSKSSANDYYNFAKLATSFIEMNPNYFDSLFFYIDDYTVTLYRSNSLKKINEVTYDYAYFKEYYSPNILYLINNNSMPYPYTSSDDLNALSLIEVIGVDESDVHGVLVFNINNDYLTSSLTNSKITQSSCVTLVKDGQILFNSKELYNFDTLENLTNEDLNIIYDYTTDVSIYDSFTFEISNNYVIYKPLSKENLGVLAVIPKKEMYLNYVIFTNTLIKFSLIILSLCLFIYIVVTNLISRPVKSLINQLDLISEDNLNLTIEIKGGKEVTLICNSINNLIKRIRTLILKVEFEMNAKRKAELNTLHSQINPHFLYNALDCIHQLCDLGDVKKASVMIDQLAIFYRIGVSKGNNIIPLFNEITHIEMYLEILKTRFEDFKYKIIFPEKYKDIQVIKLIIQPIVENAVYHGLRPFRNDGTVTIEIKNNNENLLIIVTDDGGGIQDNILNDIRNSLMNPLQEKSPYIYGLKNVNDRIRLTYGGNYGVEVNSVVDEGTIVILRLPLSN